MPKPDKPDKTVKPEFAVAAETRLALRRMFVELYLEAQDFRAELIECAEGFKGQVPFGNVPWWFVQKRASKWALRVSQLCEKWGLTFKDKAAEEAIHWWSTERRRAGDQFKPGNLINGFHAGFNLLPHDIAPPVDCWDPTRERRAAAEARLRKKWEDHLKAELDRIFEAHEQAAGTSMVWRPSERKEVAKQLRWLFERQACRYSFAKIAKGPPVADQAAVRMACGRLAGELDLIL